MDETDQHRDALIDDAARQPRGSAEMTRLLFHLVDYDEEAEGLPPLTTLLPMITMLWEDAVRPFAVDGLLIVDQTADRLAVGLSFEGIQFERYESLAEAEAAFPDAQWVYFEQGGLPLSDFEHPDGDVVYAFGPDTVGWSLEPGKTYVEIPTPRPWGFFSPTAAAIVFYDRLARRRGAG